MKDINNSVQEIVTSIIAENEKFKREEFIIKSDSIQFFSGLRNKDAFIDLQETCKTISDNLICKQYSYFIKITYKKHEKI